MSTEVFRVQLKSQHEALYGQKMVIANFFCYKQVRKWRRSGKIKYWRREGAGQSG